MQSMNDVYWLRVREIAIAQERAEAEREEVGELWHATAAFRPDAERDAA